MKRFKPPAPGTHYEIPGLEATGLIVRYVEAIPLGYFFPFRLGDCEDSEIIPDNAVIVAWHNFYPHFRLGQVTKSRLLPGFSPDQWPNPARVTGSESLVRGKGRCKGDLVRGRGTNPAGAPHQRIRSYRDIGISTDDYFQSLQAVALHLERVLASGDVNDGRLFYVDYPKPDGGLLLQRFMRLKRTQMQGPQ